MSEHELIDLLVSAQAEAGRAPVDFVTLLSAYFLCAHFVGASRTRGFAIGVALLYSLFAIWPIIGLTSAVEIVYGLSVRNGAQVVGTIVPEVAVFVPGITLGICWALSLVYMYRCAGRIA
jgi:hypothetical protein